jgi:hypothetical protein
MKQPLSTPNAMERCFTFAATTVSASFFPPLPVPNLRESRVAVVDKVGQSVLEKMLALRII